MCGVLGVLGEGTGIMLLGSSMNTGPNMEAR